MYKPGEEPLPGTSFAGSWADQVLAYTQHNGSGATKADERFPRGSAAEPASTDYASFAASDDGTFDGCYGNDVSTPYFVSGFAGFAASGDGSFERGHSNDVGTRYIGSPFGDNTVAGNAMSAQPYNNGPQHFGRSLSSNAVPRAGIGAHPYNAGTPHFGRAVNNNVVAPSAMGIHTYSAGTEYFGSPFGSNAAVGSAISAHINYSDFPLNATWNAGFYNSDTRPEFPCASAYMRSIGEAAARSAQTSLQAQDSVESPASDDASEDDSTSDVSRIGHVLANGSYECNICPNRTFRRQPDLRRHYRTTHSTQRPEFWCGVSTCERSVEVGNRPFYRKDKLGDHVRQMHSARAVLRRTARAVREDHLIGSAGK